MRTRKTGYLKDGDPKPKDEPAPSKHVRRAPRVTLSIRISQEIDDRIEAAHRARKDIGAETYSKQAIVEQAIEAWLERNGF